MQLMYIAPLRERASCRKVSFAELSLTRAVVAFLLALQDMSAL